MARPVEFERAKTLDLALRLFWRQGYQATSVADLLETMQLSRSSLYAAYGDKRALFAECLDRFAGLTLNFLDTAPPEEPPLATLQRFFEFGLRRGGGEGRWGCLLVNTSLELAAAEPELSARASAHLQSVQARFDAALRRRGCAAEQAEGLAGMLMLLLQGLRAAARRGLPAGQQKTQIAAAFGLLETALP